MSVFLVKHIEFQDRDSLGISTVCGLLNGLAHDSIEYMYITVSTDCARVVDMYIIIHYTKLSRLFARCICLTFMATDYSNILVLLPMY